MSASAPPFNCCGLAFLQSGENLAFWVFPPHSEPDLASTLPFGPQRTTSPGVGGQERFDFVVRIDVDCYHPPLADPSRAPILPPRLQACSSSR